MANTTKKKTVVAEQAYHYYATTGFAWGVGPTREDAIRVAADFSGFDRKRLVKAFNVYSVRVELPQDAPYAIEYYTPKDVPLSDKEQCDYVIKAGRVVKVSA